MRWMHWNCQDLESAPADLVQEIMLMYIEEAERLDNL